MSEQHDYVVPEPARRADARSARRLERLSSRAQEVDRALAAADEGKGALVWTAEPGMGASATLELVCEAIAVHVPARPHVTLRCRPPAGVPAPGSAVVSVVSQVSQLAGGVVPERLTRVLEPVDPGIGYLPELAAVALAELLVESFDGATVVLVADDLHLQDELSRSVLASLVAQRHAPVVLLGTAAAGALDPSSGPFELRAVPPLAPADALHLLLVERRLAVAPHVAARLAHLLGGNAAALTQTAALLTPEQLSGGSILPDPLPAVPAVRAVFAERIAALSAAERHALLVAAVAVVDRTELLLSATGLAMEEVLDGPLAEHLALVGGRFAFVDPRLRSLVHADARLAERTAAHVALADAHRRADEEDVAVWHSALATLVGDPELVPGLLRIARRHLDRGDVVWAHEVAREAASQAAGEHRAEAFAIAGAAALRSGHVQDAADWLRKASRSGDDALRARTLGPLVAALTLAEGQVPDDVLSPYLRAGQPGDLAPDDVAGVVTGVLNAARLHAERGDGVSTSQLLDTATFLASWCDDDDATAARLALARSWAAVFGVGERGGVPDADLGPDHEAAVQVSRALALAADDRLEDASQTLASAVASLAPVRDGGRWFDGPDAALTPLAEAHVRLAQTLVHLWRGTLTRAADELAEAAFRLPVGLPFAGLGVAAARRLDMMTRGVVGPVATALEETCASPTSRPVRLGLLVDRAMGAAFAHHVTQAATLLELAAERERPDSARMLPLPGLDDVEAWVVAGRHDAAQRALSRRKVDAKELPPSLRSATLVRAEVSLAAPEDLATPLERATRVNRTTASPYEHARTDLCAARALVRAGELQRAHGLFLSAIELFDDAGADPWTTIAREEHADVVRLLGGPVPDEAGPDGVAGSSSGPAVPSAASWATAVRAAGLHAPLPGVLGGARQGAEAPVAHRPAPPDACRLAVRESDVSDEALAELRGRWSDELTERELDVALLVVQGASNREAADQLYLSVRTVEVHLGRVFRKLGVRSRVELTVLAHRVGR
ncbi:helix-turn-helix domain-containing protein [Cellulosimicrobium protaetiae]|uniref:Helix-turn-helix transcriptional regulator n=1 Tax=Cellulosimicrobium protaetiae TaxID=2587808 RepID=A0A6M5UF49_9MICO|nr:helix-turn-helix transcriptional regulator [Cellulosimicrobium protaetiae]QJW35748.1 helix-turn-helix transcriptional regulator [Cellulosimicrobium protaetiae]